MAWIRSILAKINLRRKRVLPELVCDTSPLQYLHQLGQLELLPKLAGKIIVPPAVVKELDAGRSAGHDVPAPEAFGWIEVSRPAAVSAERLIGDLGPGETEVLMLAMERPATIAVVDDKLARRVAAQLSARLKQLIETRDRES